LEKFIFMATIKDRLSELNVPEQTIDKHILVFEKCFRGKTAVDIDKVIKGAGGIDGIVQSIYNLELAKQNATGLKPNIAPTSQKTAQQPTIKETENESTRIDISIVEDKTDNIDDNDLTTEYVAVDIESENITNEQESEDDEKTVVDMTIEIKKSPDFEKHVREAEKITIELEKTAANNIVKEEKNNADAEFDISEYDFDTLFATKKSKFEIWVTNLRKKMSDDVFKATLPISILAYSLLFAITALLFPLLVISSIAFSVGYILLLIGGIIFSLVPAGYGIYMSFSSLSIGLYEIGLGVSSVGVTMLLCILMHNYVKRLVPYLFVKIKALFKFCIKIAKIYFKNEIKEEK